MKQIRLDLSIVRPGTAYWSWAYQCGVEHHVLGKAKQKVMFMQPWHLRHIKWLLGEEVNNALGY